METIAVHARVRGLVQGVGFRHHTLGAARERGLAGFVQNLADGSVEVWIEGPRADVDSLVAWLHRGPPHAQVVSVDVERGTPRGLTNFDLRRA